MTLLIIQIQDHTYISLDKISFIQQKSDKLYVVMENRWEFLVNEKYQEIFWHAMTIATMN